MIDYDVAVVGAGPAGSSAARVAAASGASTVLLEEHAGIGLPVHCSGALSQTTKPELTREILEAMPLQIVLARYHRSRVFAPSGRMVKETALSECYLVKRDAFDQELARQAVEAGAVLLLARKVTGLLKQGDRVTGVTTASQVAPEIRARVVISADGIHAARKGIPLWEGMLRPEQTFTGGVSLELVNVRDIEPEVCEFHSGAFTENGFTTLWPRDESSCMTHFRSMAEFRRVKEGDYRLSRKLKDAVPVRVAGYSHTSDLGVALPCVVKEGLILTGSAGGWRGIIPAIVSGRHAGEVAAEALEDNDTSLERLSAYEGLCRSLAGAKGYLQGHPFHHLPDETIEELLLQMIERDQLTYTRPRPV